MLRVSYSDTPGGQRWSLCGRLAGPWVDELRSCWRCARKGTPRVLDLSDVTFIDEGGERLLAEMQSHGTEFVAAGVENKHLLAGLKEKRKGSVRRGIEHLDAPCGGPFTPQGGD